MHDAGSDGEKWRESRMERGVGWESGRITEEERGRGSKGEKARGRKGERV